MTFSKTLFISIFSTSAFKEVPVNNTDVLKMQINNVFEKVIGVKLSIKY